MDYSRRSYRRLTNPLFTCFTAKVKETDLYVCVDRKSSSEKLPRFTEGRILFYRTQLEEYLLENGDYHSALSPHLVLPAAPPIVLQMARAGNTAGVGPMAAVAGALAELVGFDLLQHVSEVIVENGGDIFLKTSSANRVTVFAGTSPLSGRIAMELPPRPEPYGICTSSGTVGPSLSFGSADAAVIVSRSTPLADAVATATANRIQSAGDLDSSLAYARTIAGVEGVLLIKDSKLAVWGNIRLVPAGE